MNLDEIETPETDAKYYEFNPAPQGVMVNELHELCQNLERRLHLANAALGRIAKDGSFGGPSEMALVAIKALTITKGPK